MGHLQLWCLTALLLISINTCHAALAINRPSPSPSPNTINVNYRPGTKTDEFQLTTTLALQLMNPLNLQPSRFLIATNPNNPKELYGWAQLRPLGTTALTDPSTFDAAPGSGDVERDVINEEIWDDFENDDFPIGFASLPWTNEYRAFTKSSDERRKKRMQLMAQSARDVERGRNQLWELASVYVHPTYRGRGIGSALVQKVMARHELLDRRSSDVFLLTLGTTREWYERLGFVGVEEVPEAMGLEVAVGTVVTKVMGAELICMRYRGGN